MGPVWGRERWLAHRYFSEADSLGDSLKLVNAEIGKANNLIRRENWTNRGTDKPRKELLPMVDEPALFYKEMREAGILGIIQSSKTAIRVLYDRKNLNQMTFESLPDWPIWTTCYPGKVTTWKRRISRTDSGPIWV